MRGSLINYGITVCLLTLNKKAGVCLFILALCLDLSEDGATRHLQGPGGHTERQPGTLPGLVQAVRRGLRAGARRALRPAGRGHHLQEGLLRRLH